MKVRENIVPKKLFSTKANPHNTCLEDYNCLVVYNMQLNLVWWLNFESQLVGCIVKHHGVSFRHIVEPFIPLLC